MSGGAEVAAPPRGFSVRRLARAIGRRWYWLLATPLVLVGWTTIHESCHALAAILAGGTIEEFVVLPSRNEHGRVLWGYVRYDFSATNWRAPYGLIAAAPYIGDVAIAVLGTLLLRPKPGSRASTAVLLLVFACALVDSSNGWQTAAFGGDLAHFFEPGLFPALYFAAPHLGLLSWLTWRAARRALADELSPLERASLVGAVLALPWSLRFVL